MNMTENTAMAIRSSARVKALFEEARLFKISRLRVLIIQVPYKPPL
jgi:hypothetical protein